MTTVFVYAILTGLPAVPKGAALKIGRFRHQFGIDTKSDAAANPLYNLVRKNIGFISERGIQLNGYVGPISYAISLADGPDSLRTVTEGTVESGLRIGAHGSGGGVLKPIENNSPPLFIHLNGNLPLFGKRFWVGTSYFDGNSYPFNPNTGDVNPSTLVYKRRVGIATSFRTMEIQHRWRMDGRHQYPFDEIHAEPQQNRQTGLHSTGVLSTCRNSVDRNSGHSVKI